MVGLQSQYAVRASRHRPEAPLSLRVGLCAENTGARDRRAGVLPVGGRAVEGDLRVDCHGAREPVLNRLRAREHQCRWRIPAHQRATGLAPGAHAAHASGLYRRSPPSRALNAPTSTHTSNLEPRIPSRATIVPMVKAARVLVGMALVWTVALLTAPPRLRPPTRLSRMAALVYVAGGVVCHQRPERSFHGRTSIAGLRPLHGPVRLGIGGRPAGVGARAAPDRARASALDRGDRERPTDGGHLARGSGRRCAPVKRDSRRGCAVAGSRRRLGRRRDDGKRSSMIGTRWRRNPRQPNGPEAQPNQVRSLSSACWRGCSRVPGICGSAGGRKGSSS